jgi:hypothetical protein
MSSGFLYFCRNIIPIVSLICIALQQSARGAGTAADRPSPSGFRERGDIPIAAKKGAARRAAPLFFTDSLLQHPP